MQALLNFFFKAILVVVLFGCKDLNKSNDLVFIELNKNLERSNKLADNLTLIEMHKLKEYLKDGLIAYKAKYWLDKTDTIHSLTIELLKEIDKLKTASIKGINENFKIELKSFFQKLKITHDSILNLDTKIKYAFEDERGIINKDYLLHYKNKNDFADKIFEQLSNSNITNRKRC